MADTFGYGELGYGEEGYGGVIIEEKFAQVARISNVVENDGKLKVENPVLFEKETKARIYVPVKVDKENVYPITQGIVKERKETLRIHQPSLLTEETSLSVINKVIYQKAKIVKLKNRTDNSLLIHSLRLL